MSDTETTTYTSNVSSSLKQSILDTIINIAPTDCVFYNSIGKGTAKAKSNTTTEYIIDGDAQVTLTVKS